MRMKIDIDDFQQNFQRRRKTVCIFSFWQSIFQHFLVPDNVPVTYHLWCYLGDNLQLGHDCKHWRAIVMFPVIFERHSSRPLWLFLWLAFTSIYKFSTCFMTQADTRIHVAMEGQIKDGRKNGWKSTGVLWLCWAGINISPLIRTWLRSLKRQDMCVELIRICTLGMTHC